MNPCRPLSAWLAVLFLTVTAAFAGTPLICHPYDIGAAASLPGSTGDWKGVNPTYDRSHLIRDTLALLTPETPVIVRMETLRRAAIYATAGMRGWGGADKSQGFSAEDRANTTALLTQLRARITNASGPARALALFDVGFFAETLRHTGLDESLDGYPILAEALTLRGPDAEMEFALALASAWPRHTDRLTAHLSRARLGAKANPRLAANLVSHFGPS